MQAPNDASSSRQRTPEQLFAGNGELATYLRRFDWVNSPLGAVADWPHSLHTTLRLCLHSHFPTLVWWGNELVLLYNDAWRPLLGSQKHPQALGAPGTQAWPELWELIGPQLTAVLATGQPQDSHDLPLPCERHGFVEEAYFSYSSSPILLDDGRVGGVFTTVTETTPRLLAVRRFQALQALTTQAGQAFTIAEACQEALETIEASGADVPFALLYLFDEAGQEATLVASAQLAPSHDAAAARIRLDGGDGQSWPLGRLLHTRQPFLIDTAPFGQFPGGPWPESPQKAVLLPLSTAGREQIGGALVAGLSPRLVHDDDYQRFLHLVVSTITTRIANARAYEAERRQAVTLAQHARERADASERERMRARLHELATLLSRTLSEEQVIEVVLDHAVPAIEAQAGSVLGVDESGTIFDLLGAVGISHADLDGRSHYPISTASLAGEAALSARPQFVESAAELARRYPAPAAEARQRGIVASAHLPILFEQHLLGVINFSFQRERRFTAEERALLFAFAQQCGQALERARLYEAEQLARAEAEAALHTRDVFFSVAAHELKTPLTSLIGQVQLLRRRLERDGLLRTHVQRSLDVVVAQAHRLNTMVAALLDLSRIEQGRLSIERAPLDICLLTRQVIDELLPTISDHTVICEEDEGPLMILGDALRLEQVLQNLLSNAVKFTPAGGEVDVRVFQAGDEAVITVHDNGIGIPREALPHLFDRFYRAANADAQRISGMGIGLYVVREIVALHGGSVSVESHEGQGSTFTVRLPLLARRP